VAPPVATPAVATIIPTPPASAQNVAPSALDANRIAGDKRILPDDMTMSTISRSNRDQVVGAYKLCVSPDGSIASVSQLTSTGYADYDQKIAATIRRTWRYKPYVIAGRPAAVCTAVRFVYTQK
jgi:hypothetical protein